MELVCPTPVQEVDEVSFPAGADPASLSWNARQHYLLIADNRNNRIWKWTEDGLIVPFRSTSGAPPDPTGAGRDNVGQLIELESGIILLPRFGFGTHGALLSVSAEGAAGSIADIDPAQLRLGIAITDAGQFTASFTHGEAGFVGTVNKLAIGEQPWARDFGKPVGILQRGDELIVADQARDTLVALSLKDPAQRRQFAAVPSPDLLTHGPSDSLFTGQHKGEQPAVRQICSDGTVNVFDAKFKRPGGVAYDAEGHRLFVTDSDGKSEATLRIYQL